MRADTPQPPLLLAHSLPAFGSAGLAAMLPILGSEACAIPTVLLNATANCPGVRRWPQPLAEQLEASVNSHQARGLVPDLFIGYLNDAAQARELRDWLALRGKELGTVYADPICGDDGRAYVAPDLIAEWSVLLRMVDAAFPNATEFELLARAAGAESPEAFWFDATSPRVVVVTSSMRGEQYGNRLWQAGENHFVEAERIHARFSGTGDVFAACCLHALRRGLEWRAAVHLASRHTESLIRRSLASGDGRTLCVLPELPGETVER